MTPGTGSVSRADDSLTPAASVEERMINRANARLRMGELVIESGVFKVGANSKDAQEVSRCSRRSWTRRIFWQTLARCGKRQRASPHSHLPHQIDAEVARDEEINELIMRSEQQEEYELWQQMDVEREVRAELLRVRLSRSTEAARRESEAKVDAGERSEQGGGGERQETDDKDQVPEELLGDKIAEGDRRGGMTPRTCPLPRNPLVAPRAVGRYETMRVTLEGWCEMSAPADLYMSYEAIARDSRLFSSSSSSGSLPTHQASHFVQVW
eukprot:753784-Hanusia_phi.AAC.6